MFEKLLFKQFVKVPFGEEAPVVKQVTVPPAPVLLKAVTIELLLTFDVPPAAIVIL